MAELNCRDVKRKEFLCFQDCSNSVPHKRTKRIAGIVQLPFVESFPVQATLEPRPALDIAEVSLPLSVVHMQSARATTRGTTRTALREEDQSLCAFALQQRAGP